MVILCRCCGISPTEAKFATDNCCQLCYDRVEGYCCAVCQDIMFTDEDRILIDEEGQTYCEECAPSGASNL
jgi:hypothetical protein